MKDKSIKNARGFTPLEILADGKFSNVQSNRRGNRTGKYEIII